MKILIFVFITFYATHFEPEVYQVQSEVFIGELGDIEIYSVSGFKISDDSIYISDELGKKIYQFDLEGNLLNETGRAGSGPGEYTHGPRIISPSDDKVYVIGTKPFFRIYDRNLEYSRHDKFIRSPVNSLELMFNDKKLVLFSNQFHEENVLIFNPENGNVDKQYLGFDLYPGMLADYRVLRMGRNWLFAWSFQNKFELYDENFQKKDSFSLQGFPDKAEGRVMEINTHSASGSSYREKVYKQGTFFPQGTFFEAAIPLTESLFILQAGSLTGGSERAMVVRIDGEVLQNLELPIGVRIVGYYNEVLYVYDSDQAHIKAFALKKFN